MGGAENEVVLISHGDAERWPRMGKDDVARRLALKIAAEFGHDDGGIRLAAE